MAFEINEGQIFLHTNNSDNPKAPRLKGDCRVGGIVYELALWPAKSGKEGSYSGKFKVKGETPPAEPKPQEPAQPDMMNQDIPF
jgi:hypothetical protein